MDIKIILFQKEEIRINENKKLINLADTAICCGLSTMGHAEKLKVRWRTRGITEKLNIVLNGNCSIECKNEIYEIIYKIDNIENFNRQDIFISINMALNIANICRNDKAPIFYNWLLRNYSKYDIKYKKPIIIRPEIIFLDKLEQALTPLKIKGKRQFSILSYKIDYYIPQLNIAIEYDEDDHKGYTYERHELRQSKIERNLKCRFIRLSDNQSDEYNIGLVIKELFQIAC